MRLFCFLLQRKDDIFMKTVEMPIWTFDNGWICPNCGCKHHYYRVEDGPIIVGSNASFEKCYNCGGIYPIYIHKKENDNGVHS